MTESVHTLVNGTCTDAGSLQDRGCLYGDGVFRTLRMRAGRPVWWQDHCAKLAGDCDRLGIPAPTVAEWQADLDRLAALRPEATIRLVVTRGSGERGYRPPMQPVISRIAMAYPAAAAQADLDADGIVARICHLRLATQPRLAGIKHLNRLENVLARMEWEGTEIQEGVLLDQDGRVISGVSSNLFILRGDRLQTSRLDRCGVAGVTRERLLRGAGALNLAVEERDLDLVDVMAADALLFCNSLIKLRWVRRLDVRTWSRPALFDPLLACLHD